MMEDGSIDKLPNTDYPVPVGLHVHGRTVKGDKQLVSNLPVKHVKVEVPDVSTMPTEKSITIEEQTPSEEYLFTVELKTYSSVGGVSKSMNVTVMNVASLTLKCTKCKMCFDKQFSSQYIASLQFHQCGSTTIVRKTLADDPDSDSDGMDRDGLHQTDSGSSGIHANRSPSPRKRNLSVNRGRHATFAETGRKKLLKVGKYWKKGTRKAAHLQDKHLKTTPILVSEDIHAPENTSQCIETATDVTGCGLGETTLSISDEPPGSSDLATLEPSSQGAAVNSPVNLTSGENDTTTSEEVDTYDHGYSRLKPKKVHKCSVCARVFKNNGRLTIHVRSVHTKERPFKCEECGKAFKRKGALTEHMIVHGNAEKRFLCDICGKKFLRNGDRLAHRRRHTNSFSFKCHKCGKTLQCRSALHDHLRRHTGQKEYLCTKCGQMYSNAISLRRHIISHEIKENPHKCLSCTKEYINLDELRLHECPEGKKNMCTVCGRHFFVSGALQRHMRIHMRPKQSACEFCHEKFPNELETRMHLDENIVKCSDCGKSIQKMRSCMLNKIPGESLKGKKFKCWTCHTSGSQAKNTSTSQEEKV